MWSNGSSSGALGQVLARMKAKLKNRRWWWLTVITTFSITLLFFLNSLGLVMLPFSDERIELKTCKWTSQDPVIYLMKTRTNVFYDGGQWYHMAENFLIQHSILRKKDRLTEANNIFYNFDQDHFIDNLSGVTRLIVFLGTVWMNAKPQYLHFLANPALPLKEMKAGQGILVPLSQLQQGQSIDVSESTSSTQRFVTLLTGSEETASYPASKDVCLRYMGAIGGSIRSKGEWFVEPGDFDTLRGKMKSACPADPNLLDKVKKRKKYKLVLYQRDKTRRLRNEEEALQLLHDKLPEKDWEIHADVLLTPHGFQAVLMLFLPARSIFFEIFPARYKRRVYKAMAEENGYIHGNALSAFSSWHSKLFLSMVTTKWCNNAFICRYYARSHDVLMSEKTMNKLWQLIMKNIDHLGDQDENASNRIQANVTDTHVPRRAFLFA